MDWFYRDGDKQIGPVPEDAMTSLVKFGAIGPLTPVWREGMEDWQEAGKTNLVSHMTPHSPPPLIMAASTAVPQPRAGGNAPSSSSFQRDLSKVYPSNPPKSPGLCWLALLMLGLPQMIYGQVGKGLLWLAIGMVSTFVTAGFALFILYPLVIVDAHKIGKVLQSGRPVGKMEFFPK